LAGVEVGLVGARPAPLLTRHQSCWKPREAREQPTVDNPPGPGKEGTKRPAEIAPEHAAVSTSPVIAVRHLTKRFGAILAVDDLSFTVERGQICGLLGPNGAGKTTALRALVGLVRPTAGDLRLLGSPVSPSCAQLSRVGVLIEEASFLPHLSGWQNLRLWWEAGGGRLEDADLDGALALAGLGASVQRKVRTYSRGMRQRLGLARLLLARPEVLVLDEPTAGLDPAEIREFREMLGRLARERGATVLLSSHHLGEVEEVCTHAVILDRGHLVAAGAVADLIGISGVVYLEVDDLHRSRQILAGLDVVRRVVPEAKGLAVEMDGGRRSDLVAALVAAGVRVETVTSRHGLEDAFLGLLGGER
jgi:ABC-2 type transport system ATP-binding protein